MTPRKSGVILLLLILLSIPGCTQLAPSVTQPRASLVANPVNIQVGETVGFDARDSDPIEGTISEYRWDFGDGVKLTTLSGYTTHLYEDYGVFIVTLVVVNDLGGEDSSTITVTVNGAPVIDLIIPSDIRAGDIVQLDASGTIDPEASKLVFLWDLNILSDSNGDGNPTNDIDSNQDKVDISTNESVNISGMLTVDDGQGGISIETFTLEVQTRKFKVSWMSKELTWEWTAYTEEGDAWSSNITPGDGARVISYHAILELDNDVFPSDNFTLMLRIPADGYTRSNETQPGNITQNEETKTELEDKDLNILGEDGEYESDSASALVALLFSSSDGRFGQEQWICTVTADQAEPDSLAPGVLPDPDTGNNWTLSMSVIVQIPVLQEIAYS